MDEIRFIISYFIHVNVKQNFLLYFNLDTREIKGNVWKHFKKIQQITVILNSIKISVHHLVRYFPEHDALNLYRFGDSDHNWAVCDLGIKQFNHELVLQSVEEVNVPHPRPVVGEYMGDLPTNTDISCKHVTIKIHGYKYMDPHLI